MWWRRLFRRDAMMIWLMRATEKEGDGTLDHANRRIMQSLRERSRQEAAPARPRERKALPRVEASKGTISSRPACRLESQPLKDLEDALTNDRRLYADARTPNIIGGRSKNACLPGSGRRHPERARPRPRGGSSRRLRPPAVWLDDGRTHASFAAGGR